MKFLIDKIGFWVVKTAVLIFFSCNFSIFSETEGKFFVFIFHNTIPNMEG
jgi:hypothetical protein